MAGLYGAPTEQGKLIERPIVQDTPYSLGTGDEVTVHVTDFEEIPDRPYRIDPNGRLNLPSAGSIKAAGLTPEQLQAEITARLKKTLKNPEVSLNVTGFNSQPVSVLGAVNQPGVTQLQGPKRLLEVISAAGGLRPEAGSSIMITRQAEWGQLPIPTAQPDQSRAFSTARISVEDLTSGKRPEDNIYVRPHDVITISKADLIYVIGEVKKAGGFTLAQHENMSVLQALALAEGLERTAQPKNARILRKDPEAGQRKEIPVNLKNIMDGQSIDMPLMAEDILFVPNNLPRSVALRSLEAAIQVGTGLVIWRR